MSYLSIKGFGFVVESTSLNSREFVEMNGFVSILPFQSITKTTTAKSETEKNTRKKAWPARESDCCGIVPSKMNVKQACCVCHSLPRQLLVCVSKHTPFFTSSTYTKEKNREKHPN